MIDDIRQDYWLGVKIMISAKAGYLMNRYQRLFSRGALVALYGGLMIPSYTPPHTIYEPVIGRSEVKTVQTIDMPELATQAVLEQVYVNKLRPIGTYANGYAAGNCTWLVASRLPVPDNWGNAINWGYAAAALGYTISDTPKAGAIAWSTTDSYLGHVAVVLDDGVTINEMNYSGLYSVDSRIPNPGEFRYIYI